MMHTDVDDTNFLKRILWTDESNFKHEGIVNFHNLHHWAQKRQYPRKQKQSSFQTKFSVNVWSGIIGRHLIGPHFLPERLTGENY